VPEFLVMAIAEQRLLPWEQASEFLALEQNYLDDFAPQGAAERALVDRLIWIEWRRRRLALAERAAHMAAMTDRLDDPERTLKRAGLRERAARERADLSEALAAPGDAVAEARRHRADRKATARALTILDGGGARAYKDALAALHDDTRAWWEEGLAGEYEDERVWSPDAACLAAFLREAVVPADRAIAAVDEALPAMRLQAMGESLAPDRMERLLAIESRLDRQFDKALSTLLQLQALRTKRCAKLSRARLAAPSRG
jgi:hypothetical protein